MARETILSTDTLPEGRTKLNNNVAKDDALQTATGVAESATSIGTIPGTLPTGDVIAGDTLKNAILKVENKANATITASSLRHSGANSARDKDLGEDYDYKAAAAGILGTTTITDAPTATSLGYPGGAGIYHVAITYADGQGGTAGRVRTVWLSQGTRLWYTMYNGSAWTTPLEPGGLATYTESFNATSDWGSASGGEYTITLLEATHGLGADVSVEVWDTTTNSGFRTSWSGDVQVETASGDITIKAQETPDARVALFVIVRQF